MSEQNQNQPVKPRVSITKSVSLPADVVAAAQQKISQEPDLDWSKYVRRLIRQDIATDKEVAA